MNNICKKHALYANNFALSLSEKFIVQICVIIALLFSAIYVMSYLGVIK